MTNNIYKIYVSSEGNWEELELDDLNLSTTFSMEELKDTSLRKDTISKSIVLKGTRNNNKVFGALYSIDREPSLDDLDTGNLMYNYKPNKYLDCFVLENNVEIIRGKLLVTSVNIDRGVIYYNCSVVGSVYSFFSEMNDRKLEELDYFKLEKFTNIKLDRVNIEDSWRLPYLGDGTEGVNLFSITDFRDNAVLDSGNSNLSRLKIKVKPNTNYTFSSNVPSTGSGGSTFNIFFDVYGVVSSSSVNGVNSTNPRTVNSGSTGELQVVVMNSYLTAFYNRQYQSKLEEGSMVTSWTDNPEDRPEFFFPMIDYGGEVGSLLWARNAFRWDVFRPAIYLSSYLKAIFRGFRINSEGDATQYKEDNNYTRDNLLSRFKVEGDFLTGEKFRRLFVPNNANGFTKRIRGEEVDGREDVLFKSIISASNINYDRVDNNGYRTPSSITNSVTTDSPYLSFNSKDINGQSTTVLSVSTPIKGNLEISGNINISGVASIEDRFFIARASGGEFTESDFIYSTPIPQRANVNTPVNISGKVLEEDLAYDLVFGIYHPSDDTSNTNTTFSFSNVSLWISADENTYVEVQYNDTFNVFDTIPKEVSIRDFLRNILLTFNLFIVIDKEDDSLLRIYTYDEFYKNVLSLNRDKALDWTNKVDWGKYSISSNTSLPRGYKFSYKDDGDIMNSTYKRLHERSYGEKVIADSSGLTDILKVESMFSPTINLRWNGDRDIPAIFEGDSTFSGEKKQMSSNIRLLYYSGAINTSTRYVLANAEGQILENNFTKYPFSSMNLYSLREIDDGDETGTFRDGIIATLLYGIPLQSWSYDTITNDSDYLTLYRTEYFNRIRDITDINLVTVEADMFLNEYDINTLDFRNPIYLQSPYGSSYFKLLKVEYTDSNYPSTVLLQKVVLPDTNR